MAECALCGENLQTLRGTDVNYRLETREPFERVGELCDECGASLLDRATGDHCVECDLDAEYNLTQLRLTRENGGMWSRKPEETRAVLCSAHYHEQLEQAKKATKTGSEAIHG